MKGGCAFLQRGGVQHMPDRHRHPRLVLRPHRRLHRDVLPGRVLVGARLHQGRVRDHQEDYRDSRRCGR